MAKSYKDDEVGKAIDEFKKIIDSFVDDNDTCEWVFKSYKQLVKLYLAEGELDEVLTTMSQMLPLLSQLNKSYVEESLSQIGRAHV